MGRFDPETGIFTPKPWRQTPLAKERMEKRKAVAASLGTTNPDDTMIRCPQCDGICDETDYTSYYEIHTCRECGYDVEVC